MGFWGSIGSAISSCVSGVCSCVSRVCGAVTGFASRAVSSFCSAIGIKATGFMGLMRGFIAGPLGPVFGPIIGKLMLNVAVKIVEKLAKMLGIIKEDDKTEELGYRLDEANKDENKHWKQRNDFNTLEEYYAYLKKQIPDDKIDREALRRDKDYYALLGMMAEVDSLEDSLRIKLPETFLMEAGKSRMTPDEIRAFADAFRGLGYDAVEVQDYFQGRMPLGEAKRITEALVESLGKYCPNMSEDEIYARLGKMQAIARDDDMLKEVYKKELQEIAEKKQVPEV